MMEATQATSIRQEIHKIKNLPPLPVIAQQLLGVINDEDASIADICNIIKRDPTLVSRMLGLSNSAFFGFGRKVSSLEDAIIFVLGLDLVKSLALTMVMGGVFDVRKCENFDISRYWCTSIMTADLAMQASTIMTCEEKLNNGQLFLYGLLHNLGILILTDRFPKLMNNIFEVAKKTPERRLIYTEQAMLDMDHHEAGSWLGRKWQLPEVVITVIESHQDDAYDGDNMIETLYTGYCSRTVQNWLKGNETLLIDEDHILKKVGIERAQMEIVAKKCRSKLDEFQGIANEMATR